MTTQTTEKLSENKDLSCKKIKIYFISYVLFADYSARKTANVELLWSKLKIELKCSIFLFIFLVYVAQDRVYLNKNKF